MLMYVHYYDRYEKLPEENPTIGILLCKEKDDALVEITLPEDANIYASEYQLYLPDKKELQQKLKEWIEEGTDLQIILLWTQLLKHTQKVATLQQQLRWGKNVLWLQIGYKNSENTEKINIFKRYDDRKPRKHAICQTGFPQPNP